MAREIWTEPQAPLQAKTIENNTYTIEHHFDNKNRDSRPLYEAIKEQVAQWGEVSEKFNQNYIALKIGQKVLNINPCKDYLNLYFKTDISKLDDPKGKAEKMITRHLGNGNTKIKLESPEEIPYCIDLIKQALAQKEIPK